MKIKTKIKDIMIISTALFVVGCSSQPRQVKASLPMVVTTQNLLGEVIPSVYNDKLSDPSQFTFSHKDDQINMGSFYISALGDQCRELIINSSEASNFTRVACSKINDSEGKKITDWYLTPDINQPISSFSF